MYCPAFKRQRSVFNTNHVNDGRRYADVSKDYSVNFDSTDCFLCPLITLLNNLWWRISKIAAAVDKSINKTVLIFTSEYYSFVPRVQKVHYDATSDIIKILFSLSLADTGKK